MIRKSLLNLALIGVIILPDIGSAQAAGNYDLIGVYNQYYYIVRETSNSLDDSLYASYELDVHWPSSANPEFSWTIANYEIGDTVYTAVPLLNPAILGAFGIGLNSDVFEDGNMIITGTYPSLATSDCETQITIPAITDNATYANGGDPVLDEDEKTATYGWGLIESDVFANNMYAPDLAGGETFGVDFGAGTDYPTWGRWISHYNDDWSHVESAEIYWDQIDAVESTYGVDAQGELNGHLGLSAAFGDNSTVPYLAAAFPTLGLNVGTYPIIGGTGYDLDGDGELDGVIPPPDLINDGLEWGYLFDPAGADGAPFSGDEATQFTGYYFTYNFLIGFGTLANVFGQFADPEYLIDTDGDGIPDTHQMVVNFMQQGQSAVEALGNTAEAIVTEAMTGLAMVYGVPAANAAVMGAAVGAYAETTLLALLNAGTDAVDAITQTGQATGAYALGALDEAGIDLDDSDHDFEAAGDTLSVSGASDVVFYGVFDGSVVDTSTNTYTFPTGAQAWAGFANLDTTMYPFTFPGGGEITFTGATAGAADSVDVYFRFEYNPYPNTEPSFNTAHVTVIGSEESSYSVSIPAQGANTYSSFLFYVVDLDAPVTITNVDVEMSRLSSGNGRLVFQVGNNCIPRNQHVSVQSWWVNTWSVEVDSDESLIPKEFALYENYPNPFNPTTQIAVDLPEAATTDITVWNIMGQKVATLYSGDLNAGHHTLNFDGRDNNGNQLSSGMYIYRVTAGKYNATKKMTLMK